jgi:hypothetical protein
MVGLRTIGTLVLPEPALELENTERDLFELPVADRPYLKEFNMSSKGKVVYGSSLRRWTLTIIILCTVVWWASAAISGDRNGGAL